ncbi:MAG: YCF48-related protein [Bacteroidota bacterium]
MGWAASSTGIIVKSTDGGNTWVNQKSGTTESLRSIYFIDPNNGWICGSGGKVLHTTNGGETWDAQSIGSIIDLNSVFFINDVRGWIVGNMGTILVTFNSGNKWFFQESRTVSDLYDVFFLDKDNGWVVGNYSIIHKTTTGGETSIKEENKSPTDFVLYQNYPNPFNPTTTIKFSIPSVGRNSISTSKVTLKVYDLLGREITTLVNEEKLAGNYEVKFDGSKLCSGVYFYRLTAGDFTASKKLILLK